MENAGPSRTALFAAYCRAYHQTADQPVLFVDELVAPFLGVTAEELNKTTTRPGDHVGIVINDRARRLFFAARARYAEECIEAAAATGTQQVVILGAGLDTFAYRNQHHDLRTFEVDHPATQAWKRERLTSAGIDIPSTLTLVPVDFETQDLASELASAAFTREEPAIFIWLGMIFYLTPHAARATLEYIAMQAQATEVVLDYLQPASTSEDRAHLQARAERLASAGEPFLNYFAPDEMSSLLRTLGFTKIEDRPAEDVISTFLGESPAYSEDSARTLRASRILSARR